MTQIFQRTHQKILFPVTDRSSGQAADLTGASAQLSLAANAHTAPVLQKAATSVDGGVVAFELDQNDSDRVGALYFECVVTDALGHRSVVATGTLTFTNTNDNF